MNSVCGEISYNGVHSDICPPDHDFNKVTPEYRKLLHDCLDEWLDKSDGNGIFYVKDSGPTADYEFASD